MSNDNNEAVIMRNVPTYVDQKDVAKIMNLINDAIFDEGYVATGYDNSGPFMEVIIERQ